MDEKENKPVDIYRDTWVRFLGRYQFYSSSCLTCERNMKWNETLHQSCYDPGAVR